MEAGAPRRREEIVKAGRTQMGVCGIVCEGGGGGDLMQLPEIRWISEI